MNKYFGKETISAINNFKISEYKLPQEYLKALINIKHAGALANNKLGEISDKKKNVIVKITKDLLEKFDISLFPIDVFQTGSGTSTNMNINEVIANMAKEKGESLHPNDDINRGQSSNDTTPTAINISNYVNIQKLLKSLKKLEETFEKLSSNNKNVIKVGRTHLQDAVPMTFGEEVSVYKDLITSYHKRLYDISKDLLVLPLGGTAIGSGIASHKQFGQESIKELSTLYGIKFSESKNKYVQISMRIEQLSLMNELSSLCSTLIKISNDLRLLSSGPNTGINEISFDKIQAGSSVMPGKVNPVIMEMMIQVATLIIGRSSMVNTINQNGPLQLNMMMPLLSYISNNSITILNNAINTFNDLGIKKIIVNKDVMRSNLYKSHALITILKNDERVGYDKATQIVEESKKTGLSIIEILKSKNIMSEDEIKKIFDFEKKEGR